MHGRIYNFKDVDKNMFVSRDEDTLFEYLDGEGRGIDYVEEMNENTFAKEMESFIRYFCDSIMEGGEWRQDANGKCFIKIPTLLFKEYVEDRIEKYKAGANYLSLQHELERTSGTWAIAEPVFPTLEDYYDNLIIDQRDGMPKPFYDWALYELKKALDNHKEFMKYEVKEIFDFHY